MEPAHLNSSNQVDGKKVLPFRKEKDSKFEESKKLAA